MQEFIKAFNASDMNTMVVSLLYLVLAQYSTVVVKTAISSVVMGLHYMQDRVNQTIIGKNEVLKLIDDKFFARMEAAVEALQPLADDLKAAASNGKLSDFDRAALESKAWGVFVDSLGVTDWTDFATHLFTGLKPTTSGQKDMSPALSRMRSRFIAQHAGALSRVKERKLRNL